MSREPAKTYRRIFAAALCLLLLLVAGSTGMTQEKRADDRKQETFLLTVFLKHDQSKTLEEINERLDESGFWRKFPPEGTEVVSWYVMMGIGQVVTLRVPPDRLRAVNLAIEQNAWGAFRTEFYVTYDYRHIWETTRRK